MAPQDLNPGSLACEWGFPIRNIRMLLGKGELNGRQLGEVQCAPAPESQRGCGYHSASKPQRPHLLREGIHAKIPEPREHLCVFTEGNKWIGDFRLSWKQNAISSAHLSGGSCVSKSGSHLGHWFSQLALMWPQRTNLPHSARLTQRLGCSAKCRQCPQLARAPGWPGV